MLEFVLVAKKGITDMLLQFIQDIGIDTASVTGQQLLENCVVYLSGVITAFEFQRVAKSASLSATGVSAKDLRLSLLSKSYFAVNLKYAAYSAALLPNKPETYNSLQKYVNTSDIDVIKTVMARRTVKQRIKAFARSKDLKARDTSYAAMRADMQRFNFFLPKITKHVKSRVYKKLSFLKKAENWSIKDFIGDIECKALLAYYKLIPHKCTDDYVLNYVRRAASNGVLNVIEAYTTGKRKRMESAGDDGFGGTKYVVTCQAESQVKETRRDAPSMDTGDGRVGTHEQMLDEVSLNNDVDTLASDITVERLIKRFAGRKRAALRIMTGESSDKFNEYLFKKGRIKKHEDHTNFLNRVAHTTFLKTLAEYLCVVESAFMRFVNYIGNTLTGKLEYA